MKLASVVVGCLVFVAGIVLANFLAVPDAVNASIELVNSESTPGGGLQSGFDTVQAEILKGLKGLWTFLFGLGLTGLAYATKTVAWGAQVLSEYLDSKIAQSSPESDPSDPWDMLEPVLLKALDDGDKDLFIQIAEKMAGKPFISNPEATKAKGVSNAKA